MHSLPDRREVLGGLTALTALSACTPAGKVQQDAVRPNVVLIIADDLRADAIAQRDKLGIQTPNIDALVTDGVSYDDAFVTTSICLTSRASIMTGQLASHHGYWNFGTIAPFLINNGLYARMKDSGYRTAYIGKWGMGPETPPGVFNIWYGFANEKQYYDSEYGDEHLTRFIGDKAVAAVAQLKDAPFFLTFATKAPHAQDGDPWPFQPDHAYDGMYADVSYPAAPSATDAAFEALPDFLKYSEPRARWTQRFGDPSRASDTLRDYYRLLTGLDDQVGRIVTELKEAGLYNDSLIIFTSDNGMMLGEHGLSGKWWMFEESIRVPLVIKMPASSKKHPEPQLALNIDIMPTILDVCALPIPAAVDGHSLLSADGSRQEFFYEHLFEHPAIIKSEGLWTKKYKYIDYREGGSPYEMLFDLEADPYEMTNLATDPQASGILADMKARFDAEKARMVKLRSGADAPG